MIVGVATEYEGYPRRLPPSSPRGGGKTATLAYYGLKAAQSGRTVISNFHLTGAIHAPECLENLKLAWDNPGSLILWSEAPVWLNSLGASKKALDALTSDINQLRKINCDLIYDAQRARDVHLRLRRATNQFWRPAKRHLDNSWCALEICDREHIIDVYRLIPTYQYLVSFYPAEVGAHYDTRERVRADSF